MAGQQNESSDLILNLPDNNALYCDKSSDNNEYDVSSIKNYLKLAWTGDFLSLKTMVNKYLKLDGEWISPGGEKKILYRNNTPTITWWNKKKILRIEDADNSLTEKLMSSLCCQNVVADNDFDSAICPSTFGHGCRCKELSVDMEGTKLDVAIVESKHGKMIDKNSQEISQMKCEVNNIVSQLGNINNIVNHLEEARAAIDEHDESTEVIARLRDENALLINTLNIITCELEKYRTFDIKENSGSNKLNGSIVEVVTTNANYGSGEVIAEITNNRRDNHLHQIETPLMSTANDRTLTVKDHSNHSSITPDPNIVSSLTKRPKNLIKRPLEMNLRLQ